MINSFFFPKREPKNSQFAADCKGENLKYKDVFFFSSRTFNKMAVLTPDWLIHFWHLQYALIFIET